MKSYLLVPLFWFMTGAAWADLTENTTRQYESALENFNTKDYDATIILLKNALKLSPDNLPSRILLGRAHLKKGDGAAAEKEIDLARRLGADPNLTLLPLAKAMSQQRKYRDLIATIDGLESAPSLRAEILFQRGNAYLELGNLSEAREEFERALRSWPDFVLPTVGLAMLELRQNRFEDAAKLVDRALRIDPNSGEAWHARGAVAYARGDLHKAIDHYSKALSLQPAHYTARVSRASANLDAGNYSDAVSELRVLRENVPGDPQVGYLLAVALDKSGDPSGSKEALGDASVLVDTIPYERLAEHLPTLLMAGLIKYRNGEMERAQKFFTDYLISEKRNLVALKLLSSTLLAMDNPLGAVQVLKRAVEVAPRDKGTLILLGDAYMRSGHYVLAIDSLKKAESLAPGQAEILAKLGVAHLAIGKRETAIGELEEALRNNPGATGTAMLLSAAHLGSGNPERAKEIAENLVRGRPGNPTASNLLALTYVHLEKPNLARRWFERALAIDPGFRPARINLANLDLHEGRVEQARQVLKLMLQETPDNLSVLVELSKLEKSQGDIGRARQLLEKAYSHDDQAISPALRLVDLYLEQGEAASALEVAQNLHADNPGNLAVLEALGRTQLAAGNPAEARVAFNRAGYLCGYDVTRLYGIALWQLRADAVDEARWSLQKATEGNPNFLPARLALAELQIGTGRLKKASRLIDGLVESHPEHPAVSNLRGDLAMSKGDFKGAIRPYRKAREKLNSSDTAIRLFRAQSAVGEHKQALSELTDWVQKYPLALAAKRVLAETHHAAGRLEEARTYYEQILEHEGDDADLLNNLSNLYADQGDPRSLELALRAHDIEPSDPGVTDTLGWLLVQSGQAEKGLGYLRDASARDSSSPEIRYHLAVALAALKRNEEARQEVQRALNSPRAFNGMAEAQGLLSRLDE